MKTTPFHRADPHRRTGASESSRQLSIWLRFRRIDLCVDRSRPATPDATQTGDFARPILTDAAATRRAIVPDSIHGACDPSAAHNVYSALTAVICRRNLISLRSAAHTASPRVRVRGRIGIGWILLAARDIGPIIVTARRRRPITAVPTIIAAVPRRVAPHHHRRAPMLDMGQGYCADARGRHDLSRRCNRRPDHRRRCQRPAAAARSQPGSLEFGIRYGRVRQGRQ